MIFTFTLFPFSVQDSSAVGTVGYCRETLCKNNNNNNLESVSISFSRLVGEIGDGLAVFTTPYLLRLSPIVTDRLNILLLAKEKPSKEKNTHVCI